MDPNECLKLIDESVKDNDETEADWHCYDLMQWLKRGGFQPNWKRYPNATYHFNGFWVVYNIKTGTYPYHT